MSSANKRETDQNTHIGLVFSKPTQETLAGLHVNLNDAMLAENILNCVQCQRG